MTTVSATSPAPITSSHATAVPSDVRDRQPRAHGRSELGAGLAGHQRMDRHRSPALGRRPPHPGDPLSPPQPVAPCPGTGGPMAVHERSASAWHKVAHGGRRSDHSSAQRAAESRGETIDRCSTGTSPSCCRSCGSPLPACSPVRLPAQPRLHPALPGPERLRPHRLHGGAAVHRAGDHAAHRPGVLPPARLPPATEGRPGRRRGPAPHRRPALLIPAISSSAPPILDVWPAGGRPSWAASLTVLVGLLTWYALPLAVRFAGQRR